MNVKGTTDVFAVWGFPVKHSASPAMHNAAIAYCKLNAVYVPFEVNPERLGKAVDGVRALGIRGVNVTVPHKEAVVPFLDALTPEAARLGAVNTLYWDDDRLCGDTTDGRGYLAALKSDALLPSAGDTVVVLGAGGSARSVVSALSTHGCKVVVANRTISKAESLIQLGATAVGSYTSLHIVDALRQAKLVVNTTTLGMAPNDGSMPDIQVDVLPADCVISDLVYRPARTELLRQAESRGLKVQNGLEMLVRQGALSFECWFGVDAPLNVMRQAVQDSIAT